MFISLLVLYALPVICFLMGLVGLWKNPSRWRRYLPMCLNLIFVGAYSYVPEFGSNWDLTRYFPTIEFYGTLPLLDALTYEGGALFSQYFYFWLFGSMHMMHLVPAISTTTVYAVAGYITCDTAERYNGKKYIILIILLQWVVMPYQSIIDNVRNVFGLSLITLAVYLDIVKGKRSAFIYFLYVFGCMMHLSACILILFRIVSVWAKKCFEIVILSQVLFAIIITRIYEWGNTLSYIGFVGVSIRMIIVKLNNYLNNTTNPGAIKYLTLSWADATNLLRLVMVVGALLAVIIVLYALRKKKSWFKDDNNLYAYVGMIALTVITFHIFFLVPNYWRFGTILYVVIGVVLIPLLCANKNLSLLPKSLLYGNLLLLPIAVRTQEVMLRRLPNIIDWSFDALTTNYFTILFDFIKGNNMWF